MNADRDWGRLLFGHALAALVAPGFGTILFMAFSYGASGLDHFGGALAIAFGLLFSYFLYSVKVLMIVCLSSPAFWLLSKLRSPFTAYSVSAALAALLGWFVGIWWFGAEEPSFIRNAAAATAITAAVTGVVLAFSWRSSGRNVAIESVN
jgi:hypothetical protein